jgi:hypothetical protein
VSLAELLQVVTPPEHPLETGDAARWTEVERRLGTRLPEDYRDFGLRYGSGYFDDPGRLMVYVWNPFSPRYVQEVECCCEHLRKDRGDLPKEPNLPYGVFPHQPGWLPWGNDIDGSLLCWLTEGAPDDWPVILLSPERTSFQQLPLPLTTFLARVFSRQLRTILWHAPVFFAGPEPLRFVPEGGADDVRCRT